MPRLDETIDRLAGTHWFTVLDAKSAYWTVEHLDETMGLLGKAGFRLNQKKCKFAVRTFMFLGHLITPSGVLPDPDKVKAILQMTAPQIVKQVCQFLGATGFFRKHVKDYAAVAAPLSSLLKKQATFHWGPIQQAAFEVLKLKLASEPILKQPDFDRPFEVHWCLLNPKR
ncbi:uncharacterized mitochondrial protein AtMg00860-like [Penaeus monodon]|uniref:uncharacterized mitochondrial protein AtMg00860-like n=1 Tax=Penaeus monodon TaxID=6687 RepID=UPI0018A7B344|nr:uncharacterized mitochondrial protein AtMg00860-like [Penaeus monodon]